MKDLISLEKWAISAQTQLLVVTKDNCLDSPCSQRDYLMVIRVGVAIGPIKTHEQKKIKIKQSIKMSKKKKRIKYIHWNS